MNFLQSPTVTVPGTALSIGDILRSLHQRSRLKPLLLNAAIECLALEGARAAAMSVLEAELQHAADQFRYRQGLGNAEQTRQWLASEGLTPDDLEQILERDLLIEKFRRHLADSRLVEHFEANRDCYARVLLRLIVVGAEGTARELKAQILEEGQHFAELASKHSLHGPSRLAGGSVGVVARHILSPELGDTIFASSVGDVVGPLPSNDGFRLFLVEELLPSELDDETQTVIRQEFFQSWVNERLRDVRIDLSFLGANHDVR